LAHCTKYEDGIVSRKNSDLKLKQHLNMKRAHGGINKMTNQKKYFIRLSTVTMSSDFQTIIYTLLKWMSWHDVVLLRYKIIVSHVPSVLHLFGCSSQTKCGLMHKMIFLYGCFVVRRPSAFVCLK